MPPCAELQCAPLRDLEQFQAITIAMKTPAAYRSGDVDVVYARNRVRVFHRAIAKDRFPAPVTPINDEIIGSARNEG